jgi:hypothetical protein
MRGSLFLKSILALAFSFMYLRHADMLHFVQGHCIASYKESPSATDINLVSFLIVEMRSNDVEKIR